MTSETMSTPPFRADIVGSFLRPASVKQARKARLDDKTLSAEELKAVEDAAIIDVIRMQEAAGLKAVTDGEFRRAWWHFDFMGMLDGLEIVQRDGGGIQFHGVKTKADVPIITGRLDFPDDHPMLEHFKFVKAHTKVTPKISIPGPSADPFPHRRRRHRRRTSTSTIPRRISRPSPAPTTRRYRPSTLPAAATCRWTTSSSPTSAIRRSGPSARPSGEDPDWLIGRYAKMMHDAIADRPADMLIGMHMCRGNFKSTWVAEGAYDPAADAVFNQTGVDIYFMEYDSDRAGGFEPLRLLPKGKKRVLPGFITTKTAELEDIDELKRKFEAASKYADIDQLGIAPQCGFASTEEGNAITEDDQKRKLELVVRTAEAIWGGV